MAVLNEAIMAYKYIEVVRPAHNGAVSIVVKDTQELVNTDDYSRED